MIKRLQSLQPNFYWYILTVTGMLAYQVMFLLYLRQNVSTRNIVFLERCCVSYYIIAFGISIWGITILYDDKMLQQDFAKDISFAHVYKLMEVVTVFIFVPMTLIMAILLLGIIIRLLQICRYGRQRQL